MLTQTDKNEIKAMIRAEVKDQVKREVKSFLDTTDATKKVIAAVRKEFGNISEKRMVEISTRCIVELFKNLWTRKSFWEGSLKNLKP
jgi:hypothetical protein